MYHNVQCKSRIRAAILTSAARITLLLPLLLLIDFKEFGFQKPRIKIPIFNYISFFLLFYLRCRIFLRLFGPTSSCLSLG